MASLVLKWMHLSPDSDLRVHYRPNVAHFRSESIHDGLNSCIFLKGLTVSSVVIGYLLTKHFVIGYLLTKCNCTGCGPHPVGHLTHRGPRAQKRWAPLMTPAPPRGCVHGDVLCNLEAVVTLNPFAAFTMWSERLTEKSSHPIQLILDWLHIELSY